MEPGMLCGWSQDNQLISAQRFAETVGNGDFPIPVQRDGWRQLAVTSFFRQEEKTGQVLQAYFHKLVRQAFAT